MDEFRIDEAVSNVRTVVQSLNVFIDTQKPWELNKKGDTAALGHAMRTSAWLMRICEGMFRPITPALSDGIASLLKLAPITSVDEMRSGDIAPEDHDISKPEPIYLRLEKKMPETETTPVDEITIDDFMKVKLRVGRILDAEPVPDADKLLRLQLMIGEERRQVLAGIAQQYKPEEIIGKQVVVVTNLKSRKMRGFESQGMILAADGPDGEAIILHPDKEAPEGAAVH